MAMASYKSPTPIPVLHPIILALTIAIALTSYLAAMYATRATAILLASVPFLASGVAAEGVDAGWYPPSRSEVNDLDSAVNAEGVYGFIFDSSVTPDEKYGTYNWCNMPHARKREYVRAPEEYELQYVELSHRHHKRTPYSSNAFPVEPYRWDCDDQGLFYYGEPFNGQQDPSRTYWKGYTSDVNPFVPSGWIGSCKFPQITAEGLDDSWVHGRDLYGVYHDLLGFLPARNGDWASKVRYRVTNNEITSQVAGMLVNGMWGVRGSFPLYIQAGAVDSLEPKYSCPAGNRLFDKIKSPANGPWEDHLDAAASLFATLDDISGVPADDAGFHASFDHYFDNLSARQCHAKPLPCKLVNGANSTTCVTQPMADAVYRMGQWEYSRIYRDSPDSLAASAASYGVWIAELAANLRAAMAGTNTVIYTHNIAHDGSISRLLSILQLDAMVWPGMGSEVVFELYRKKTDGGNDGSDTTITNSSNADPTTAPTTTTTKAPSSSCKPRDPCLSQVSRNADLASQFCPSYTQAASAPVPKRASRCAGAPQVSSACAAVLAKAEPTLAARQESAGDAAEYFVRVLFNGQVLRSSSPALGDMDMVPAQTLLGYFDGLVGEGAELVKGLCE